MQFLENMWIFAPVCPVPARAKRVCGIVCLDASRLREQIGQYCDTKDTAILRFGISGEASVPSNLKVNEIWNDNFINVHSSNSKKINQSRTT